MTETEEVRDAMVSIIREHLSAETATKAILKLPLIAVLSRDQPETHMQEIDEMIKCGYCGLIASGWRKTVDGIQALKWGEMP